MNIHRIPTKGGTEIRLNEPFKSLVCQISAQLEHEFVFYGGFFIFIYFFIFFIFIIYIYIFFNPGLMDCPFLPPPAQIASAGQLNKIKQTNGIPQSLSPLTVESWCKHQWKTVPHEYTELPSATTKSSVNNASNPEPQNNHLPTFWPEEKQVAYKKQ